MLNSSILVLKKIANKYNNIGQKKYKNILIYLLTSLITASVSILCNPFLAMGLSHSDYAILGYYSTISAVFTTVTGFSLTTYYARNYHLLDARKRNELLQTILSVYMILGLCAFVFLFTIYYFYHIYFMPNIPFNPYAILSLLPSYFSLSYSLYLLDKRMQDKAKDFALLSISNSLLNALISVLLVYILPFGAIGRLSSLTIVALLFGFYSYKMEKFSFHINIDFLKKAFSFCWPATISSMLTFFFMGIDRTFLARMDDMHNLGLYNVGIQISSYLCVFNTVLLQTFDPDLYKYTSLKKHKKVFLLFIFLIVMSFIPNACFVMVAKPLISLLTAGRYTNAAFFARILCLSNVSAMFAFVLSGILLGYGYSKYELYNRIAGAVMSIALYYYLIKWFGFTGAAWGQSVSWFIMGIISLSCLLLLFKKEKLKLTENE